MTRLRHRIPVKLRHNWKLVALCVAFLAACWGVFGSGTIRPYVTTSQTTEAATVVTNLTGTKDLFDASVPHQVTLTFPDAAYEDMLAEYLKEGEKKYVEADLTIDGTRIPSVGVRLKGNSTLMGLTWKGQSAQRGMGGGGGRRPAGVPEGFQPPDGFQPPGNGRQQPADQPQADQSQADQPQADQPQAGQPQTGQPQTGRQPGGGGGRGPGGFGAQLKGEEPENLPWLISFDEFVEGRRYQGHSQVAVRPASTGSTAMLNEALGIALVGASGEPTQRSTYSSFTVNGRSSTPRLLVEYLDEGYAETLGDGVLYKSLASGSFTYKGEDQTEYTTDFKQINKVGGKDMQPVIELVKWVNEASDAEFAKGLADRLDVESFARYLVLQNMMVNFDDMAGPGKNYYLWYDLDTKKFKVVTWDLNLAFNGNAESGVNDTISMGFGRGRPQQNQQNEQAQAPPGGGGGGGMMRMGHPLKEKFLANATFKKLYEEQYRALYTKLLGSGTATGLVNDLVAAYNLNEKSDPAKIEEEAKTLRTFLQTRTQTLRADKAITGA
ncbi:spore coat protein CotH [Nonomuraea sp. PA05]|uniref:CotH kinase family protein n=1 Tax=Nonomuraea sp. PA05 TaxID=2604466 RepID=UPI0011D76E2E|nr:CotH kinase family protein [Nonomuraea sp. PA05]TYB57190.1 spore coat protein CotH [Nonomuraea sp. PA05]